MLLTLRFRASALHLAGTLAIALLAAILVFGLWYPYPYDKLVGGQALFLILISVDVVCGPLLTLVVFNPKKPRGELWRDMTVIVTLQLAALGYGLYSMALARPVFLAFEKDQFRVVRYVDIQTDDLNQAPATLRPGWFGPRLIGVRVTAPNDPGFLKSLELSLSGVYSAFRPGQWVSYDSMKSNVLAHAHPIAVLRGKHPDSRAVIDTLTKAAGQPEANLVYLPVTAGNQSDWVAVLNVTDAKPVGYLHLDGW